MKCQVCGNKFKTKTELTTHLKKTVCGTVDISKPLICSFSYKTTETKDMSKDTKQSLLAMKENWDDIARGIEDSAEDIVDSIDDIVDAVTLFCGKLTKGALEVKESKEDN